MNTITLSDKQYTELVELVQAIKDIRSWRDSDTEDFDEELFNDEELGLAEQLVDVVISIKL